MSKFEVLKKLCNVGGEEFKATWSSFLFDVENARLVDVTTEEAKTIVGAGAQWQGGGLSTSQASRRLYEATGVPLVADSVSQYRDCWLFALSMNWGLDISQLSLSDRAAEAAFALASMISMEEEDDVVAEEVGDADDAPRLA